MEMTSILIAVHPQQSLHLLHEALWPAERPMVSRSLLIVVSMVGLGVVILNGGKPVCQKFEVEIIQLEIFFFFLLKSSWIRSVWGEFSRYFHHLKPFKLSDRNTSIESRFSDDSGLVTLKPFRSKTCSSFSACIISVMSSLKVQRDFVKLVQNFWFSWEILCNIPLYIFYLLVR